MDPKAPEGLTWSKAYEQAVLQVEADIMNGKGIYARRVKEAKLVLFTSDSK